VQIPSVWRKGNSRAQLRRQCTVSNVCVHSKGRIVSDDKKSVTGGSCILAIIPVDATT